MEEIVYLNMVKMECNHWWYKGRREIISKLLNLYLSPDMKILDAGCGAGGNMVFLEKYGSVMGIDISPEMVEHCKKIGLMARRESVTRLSFEDQSFDLVLCLDVLEHLENDQKALEELKRVLRPGGLLLITVPSFSWLWGRHDELNQHYRRYDSGELQQILQSAGFQVERSTYFNFFLLPPVWLVRKLGRMLPAFGGKTDFQFGCGRLNLFFYAVMKLEAVLMDYVNLPIGVSQLILARKKESSP
ncbi:class I SAM-dependent methyltransferase [Desulforamulus ruminis]|uniref:Methyltransferase type 11 n=2 Tax=Desulforamulus ruminis TaxID=1564 RepID=F6DS18_DESRL|nr:class I SAM-dependent methyltransferase [Desulforamulus ruminis]AEG61042.1 Methyltransferase type 11 [Desulforamulus ruminis DSM 2154]